MTIEQLETAKETLFNQLLLAVEETERSLLMQQLEDVVQMLLPLKYDWW